MNAQLDVSKNVFHSGLAQDERYTELFIGLWDESMVKDVKVFFTF